MIPGVLHYSGPERCPVTFQLLELSQLLPPLPLIRSEKPKSSISESTCYFNNNLYHGLNAKCSVQTVVLIQEELTKEERQDSYTTWFLKGASYVSGCSRSHVRRCSTPSIHIGCNPLQYRNRPALCQAWRIVFSLKVFRRISSKSCIKEADVYLFIN